MTGVELIGSKKKNHSASDTISQWLMLSTKFSPILKKIMGLLLQISHTQYQTA